MPVECVPEFDTDGRHVGGHTESVVETPAREESDCYACGDAGCPACDGSEVDPTRVFTLEQILTTGWGEGPGGFGAEVPF